MQKLRFIKYRSYLTPYEKIFAAFIRMQIKTNKLWLLRNDRICRLGELFGVNNYVCELIQERIVKMTKNRNKVFKEPKDTKQEASVRHHNHLEETRINEKEINRKSKK